MDFDILYWAMGALAVGGLGIGLALSRRAPVAPRSRFVARVRASLPALIVFGCTALAIGLQNRIEPWATRVFSWDLTPLAYAVEGNAVEVVQGALRCRALDWGLTLVYSLGAFVGYNVPFFALVLLGRARSALIVAASGAVIWAVAIVFYTFVPVSEVWMTAEAPYHYTAVVNVLFETLPATPQSPSYLLQLNNNFPSLHVAGMVGVALALRRAGERTLFRLIAPLALGVTLATVYLGIHWLVDVAAGVALAWAASVAGVRIADRRAASPAPAAIEPAA